MNSAELLVIAVICYNSTKKMLSSSDRDFLIAYLTSVSVSVGLNLCGNRGGFDFWGI